jgi:hypothetical protein
MLLCTVRLRAGFLCRLVRFPKPQLLMYTLLMVPVIYGAAKLVASASSSGDTGAGLACVVLLPLPVLAYWAYVLWIWYTDPVDAFVKRSKSNIMRTYQRPASMAGTRTAEAQEAAANQQQQRAQATLALLGDLDDNPTLIIRDRRSGEDELDEIFDRGTRSSSDDGEGERSRLPASRPTASGAGGAAAADGMARVRSQRQPAVSVEGKQQQQQGGSRWRSLVSEQGNAQSSSAVRSAGEAGGSGSARSSRSMEGSTGGAVLGSRSKVLRAGSPAAPPGEELAPQGGLQGLTRLCSVCC